MPLKKSQCESRRHHGSTRTPISQRPARGRASSRSRFGCTTCKRRHVRCDETYPSCGHCSRLRLQCYYLPRSRETLQAPVAQRRILPSPSTSHASINSSFSTESTGFYSSNQEDFLDASKDSTDSAVQFDSFSWCDDIANSVDNVLPELDSSWAGELQAIGSPRGLLDSLGVSNGNPSEATSNELQASSGWPGARSFMGNTDFWPLSLSREDGITVNSIQRAQEGDNQNIDANRGQPNECSFKVFGNIMQPPAAMLMGGVKKWRHLQQYLITLGSLNQAVMNSLLCIDKILEWDGMNQSSGPTEEVQKSIQTAFRTTDCMIRESLSSTAGEDNSKMDEWLAAIFLLAWIQVLRDRVEENSNSWFPSDLADTIITGSYDWNWYSRQLLSWFNSLDSKASHLSGPALLSTKALKVVSRYPVQIISCVYEESKRRQESFDEDQQFRRLSTSTDSRLSEHSNSTVTSPALSSGDVKEIILKAILQPAAEWYLESQAYCRQISALDKHHHERFTPDAEIKVALVGKRLQKKLWDLWAQRPSAISLTSAELSKSVVPDVATRLQEVSSVYLASFWILFVYLHRVCWWHLSHTGTVSDAMEETWKHMQNSYGEADDSSQQKTVHPALMWPVFLLGAECSDGERQSWAVGQLRALGKARPVLESVKQDGDTVPAFRMSRGATRNAKRAALLLEALIKKQDEAKCRVDDRDLAMDMFGCYFSIV